MTIYTDNSAAFLGFPEMKPPEKDEKLRLEVSAYLQENHGFSQEAAEAAVLRMNDAELGRFYSTVRTHKDA